MADMKNKPAMSHEDLLINNRFSSCGTDELLSLWNALLLFHANGYIAQGSPLEQYQQMYVDTSAPGMCMVEMEIHLLQAIAVKFAEEKNGGNAI